MRDVKAGNGRKFNFCAGPAVMPEVVLEQARDEMLSYRGSGLSVMEISHRTPLADEMFAEAEENLRRLLRVPDSFRVLFLQGGGQLQFSMVPMNFLRPDEAANYIVTGHWGRKAIEVAGLEGNVHIAWDGGEGDANYVRVPANGELDLAEDAAYTYFTSNETIQGVQFHSEPEAVGPLVCDASSDFLSRPVDLARYGLYSACAQKNAGPSGLTIVLVSDEMLDRQKAGLHKMLDYRRHADAGSRLNTPPMFAVYLFGLITRWIERDMGGLEALAERNERQAQRLYATLDDLDDVFATHAERASRSRMNVTFRCLDSDLDAVFLHQAEQRGLVQLEGHRSVGGMRASIYNAMPEAGVDALRELLVEFASSVRSGALPSAS